MSRRPSIWKYTGGRRPHRVTVREKSIGGNVRVQVCDKDGRMIRSSLGYPVRDESGKLMPEAVEQAEAYADAQAVKLRVGTENLRHGNVTLRNIVASYLHHRTPRKVQQTRKADESRAKLWCRVLGSDRDPLDIRLAEWERFIDYRRAGEIDAQGRAVPEEKRKQVGDRTIEADCLWLNAVFNWARNWRTSQNRYLLAENPVRGFDTPKEKNPAREIITEDRHRRLRMVTDAVPMEVRWSGKREKRRSYVSDLIDIANGTGRRISAICGLRYADLNGDRTSRAPNGAITWRSDEDKEGYEWREVPITAEVRAAFDRIMRERPGIGDAPCFPSPGNPDRAITKRLANTWFREAEKLAHREHGLAPLPKGRTFHGYRAKFASETKHLPDVDRAAVGGWKSTETLRTVYDQPDQRTMLRVIFERGEVREAK